MGKGKSSSPPPACPAPAGQPVYLSQTILNRLFGRVPLPNLACVSGSCYATHSRHVPYREICSDKILLNKIYKHYKGNLYRVIAFAKHSETCEDMVVYQSVKNGEIWCRPQNMWFDKIDENITRFTLID